MPKKSLHGVFLVIFNKGVLLTGDSGTGKSECALALIDRGHQLVCDDAPLFTKEKNHTVIGQAVRYASLLEVRGLGIIDVNTLFGQKALAPHAKLDLVIELKSPSQLAEHERPVENKLIYKQILDVPIPHLSVSVMLKFHMAVLVETAVRSVFTPTSDLQKQCLGQVDTV